MGLHKSTRLGFCFACLLASLHFRCSGMCCCYQHLISHKNSLKEFAGSCSFCIGTLELQSKIILPILSLSIVWVGCFHLSFPRAEHETVHAKPSICYVICCSSLCEYLQDIVFFFLALAFFLLRSLGLSAVIPDLQTSAYLA